MATPPMTPAERALFTTFESMDPAMQARMLKRMIDSVPSPVQRELGVQVKKAKVAIEPVTSDDAIKLGMLLEALDLVSGVRWVDYVLWWVGKHYELRPNDYGGPRLQRGEKHSWRDRLEQGPNADNSTALCLVPKAGGGTSPAAKDGYVTFNIPALWVDLLRASTESPYSLGKKSAAHRLILLGSEIPPAAVEGGEITEASHICGNPFCLRHLRWETKSLNQSRGPCFRATAENKAIPCNGHGTNPKVYCIRTRDCAFEPEQCNDPQVEAVNGRVVKDERDMAECLLIREYLRETEADRERRRAAYDAVKGGGRGVTKFQAFFRTFPRFVSDLVLPKSIKDQRAEFDRQFTLLQAEARRDNANLQRTLQAKWRSPPSATAAQSPSP